MRASFVRGALFSAMLVARLAVAADPPPAGLTLSLNDSASAIVFRGWPLVLGGQVYLKAGATATLTVDPAVLRLVIESSGGAAADWPVRRAAEPAEPVALRPQNSVARVSWILSAEETRRLAASDYTARLEWGGQKSPSIRFTVADEPSVLEAREMVRKVRLQSDAALLLGDTAGALAAIDGADAAGAGSVTLLLQRARVQERLGDAVAMLAAAQQALEIFEREAPEADHPPLSILEVQSRALAKLVRAQPPGARKVAASPGAGEAQPNTPAPQVDSRRALETGPLSPPPPSPATPAGPPAGKVVTAAELDDAKIRADAAGQWAASAKAKSSYSNPNYGPAKATGAPDVGVAGDSIDAWCPGQQNAGTDWLEVMFAKPARATEVRVRQTFNPGAIVKVEAIAPDGTTHLWWQGTDPYRRPATREIAWFAVNVPPTSYPVAKIKLTLNLAAVPGWKQIDAVQLVAAP